MKLKVKRLNFETGNVKVVVLNSNDVAHMGQKAGDRLILKDLLTETQKPLNVILDIAHSDDFIKEGEIGIYLDILREHEGFEGKIISVVSADAPESFKYIKKKIQGKKLSTEEINSIIADSVTGHLSSTEE